MPRVLLLLACCAFLLPAKGQTGLGDGDTAGVVHAEQPWYESFKIRGYAQIRYNGLFVTNDSLGCDQCDRSWGHDGGIFLRRLRIAFSGYVHPRVYVYVQPDFVSWVGSSGYVAQLRDCYVDLGLDRRNEFRVRLGQSKLPYGHENMQSSSQRIPLDRADPLNSAQKDERDLGAFLYWSPSSIRDREKMLVASGMKGKGDFGVFGFGLYNGQGANRLDQNRGMHVVARAAYPFTVRDQVIEASLAGYTGEYMLQSSQLTPGIATTADRTYDDRRAAATLSLYPSPFGLLAEYNVGRGPEFDAATDSIVTKDLSGGYVMAMYRIRHRGHEFMPFVRYQQYAGGKKFEQDARSYAVNDLEFGVEWQPNDHIELTCEYYLGDRRYIDLELPVNHQQGGLLRIQAQFSF